MEETTGIFMSQRLLFEKYIAYTKERLSIYKPDTIVLELLGDWFNVDSPSNMTVAGTVQAEDSRFIKTQCYAETMLVDAIESLHEITNNVTLLIVPGNHDATRILFAWQVCAGILQE